MRSISKVKTGKTSLTMRLKKSTMCLRNKYWNNKEYSWRYFITEICVAHWKLSNLIEEAKYRWTSFWKLLNTSYLWMQRHDHMVIVTQQQPHKLWHNHSSRHEGRVVQKGWKHLFFFVAYKNGWRDLPSTVKTCALFHGNFVSHKLKHCE